MMMELIASAMGTVAFALLFGVPTAYYLTCGAIGAAGWLMYRLMLAIPIGPTFAVFFATVVIVLLTRFAAVWRKCPATVFLITGIFPLVPGAKFYWAAYYLVTNQIAEFLETGFAAVKIMVAIVLGIIFVFELPHRMFQLPGRNKKAPKIRIMRRG
ncbi:MAG: threonine/serine exporter family protein [Clostridia bacterium]|nr:threonine/serine exporter family protein [Clostridia bacterium]